MKKLIKLIIIILFINILHSSISILNDKDIIISYNDNNYSNMITDLKNTYNNDDIIARLIIDSLDIDIILTQYTNNKYYLNHNLYKNYSKVGNAFIDYRTDINSNQINIYGHNSKTYDIPFTKLTSFLDYNFFLNNKTITLITNENKYNYEIFSVYGTVNNLEHMKINFTDNNQLYKHYLILKNNSIYNTNIDISYKDNILIIQTCLYDENIGKYLVICAKRVLI
jgi:sortase B